MFSPRNKKKCQFSDKKILVGQVDFGHYLPVERNTIYEYTTLAQVLMATQNPNKVEDSS